MKYSEINNHNYGTWYQQIKKVNNSLSMADSCIAWAVQTGLFSQRMKIDVILNPFFRKAFSSLTLVLDLGSIVLRLRKQTIMIVYGIW